MATACAYLWLFVWLIDDWKRLAFSSGFEKYSLPWACYPYRLDFVKGLALFEGFTAKNWLAIHTGLTL
jgi:hypothetical protein